MIYLIGSDFFPEEVHAQLGDTLMFVNLTNSNQLIEANDGSWASGTLGYHNTYPIMLDHETDWDFTGTTYSYSYWGTYETTFDGRALDTPTTVKRIRRTIPMSPPAWRSGSTSPKPCVGSRRPVSTSIPSTRRAIS